jgi:hypothetical protein
MDYRIFLGVATGVQGLMEILSRHPYARVSIAEAQPSCTVEVYYDKKTDTITLA